MEDISLHILDIAENSVAAGATIITINVTTDKSGDMLSFEIEDNGRGVSDEVLKKILDPFYSTRKTRKIGLGLSLLAQAAEEAGGGLAVTSKEGTGTLVSAHFKYSHIDRKPLGDLAETFAVLIAGNPDIDFLIRCSDNGNKFLFDTRSIRPELEGIPLNAPDVIAVIRQHLKESLADMR